MKDQKQQGESDKEPKRFPMDQLGKETGHETNEEYASEVAAPYAAPKQAPVTTEEEPVRRSESVTKTDDTSAALAWSGYAAIVLSVASLFIYPVLFGSAGALLGLLAYSQGQKSLGVWSVILGLVSLAGYFLLVPMYTR